MRDKDEIKIINGKKVFLPKETETCHRCFKEVISEEMDDYYCKNCIKIMEDLTKEHIKELNNMSKEKLIELIIDLENSSEN